MLKGWIQLTVVCVAVAVFTGCSSHASPLLQGASTPVTPQLPTAESSSAPGLVAEYPIPIASSGSTDITSGPDGNLWFTEIDAIGKLTTTGKFHEYSCNCLPFAITVGPDKNMWFAYPYFDSIGRVTIEGTISSFSLDGFPGFTHDAQGVAGGQDGNLWITDQRLDSRFGPYSSWIDVMTPAGKAVVSYEVAGGLLSRDGLARIIAGSDGNLWFAVTKLNEIGKVSPRGVIAKYSVPTASSGLGRIALGPDGNVWFTENSANKVGKITPTGVITEYPIITGGSSSSTPLGITAGPDGNVWFTENSANKIGRITRTGVITQFPIRTVNSGPAGITEGPDGNLWFVESNANKIAKFRP